MILCARFLIESVSCVAKLTQFDIAFFGIILLPMITGMAELAPAVFFTYQDTMNLAGNVIVRSGMQIALLVMQFLVILGWIIG